MHFLCAPVFPTILSYPGYIIPTIFPAGLILWILRAFGFLYLLPWHVCQDKGYVSTRQLHLYLGAAANTWISTRRAKPSSQMVESVHPIHSFKGPRDVPSCILRLLDAYPHVCGKGGMPDLFSPLPHQKRRANEGQTKLNLPA
jgi:hypothetical protein